MRHISHIERIKNGGFLVFLDNGERLNFVRSAEVAYSPDSDPIMYLEVFLPEREGE